MVELAIERIEHFENRQAAPVTAVEDEILVRLCDQLLQRPNVRVGKVGDVDIVAHAGAVGRVVIASEHVDVVALTDRGLDRDLDQVSRSLADLPRPPVGIGAGDVEIAKGAIVERIGGGAVGQHPLGHQLGCAIGIYRLLGLLLVDRHPLGSSVDRGGRREEDMPDARIDRDGDQRMGRDGVVAVIVERLLDAFGNDDRAGEMHDGAGPPLGENALEQLGVGDRSFVEGDVLRDDLAGPGGQIVDHRDRPAAVP